MSDGQPSDRSKPWWVIQDLTGDAVAVVEKPSASQAAAVAWQCTYEPYGGVVACRTLRAHPPLWVGHKGLFADNLDAQVFTALSPQERPVLSARLPLHYHVRNRSLLAGEPVYPSDHPEAGAPRAWAGGMGRFLQPDPNGTGVGVMESPAWHGEALAAPTPHADLAAWSGDGVGALAYCGGEPVNGADAMGLFGLFPLLIHPAGRALDAHDAMDTFVEGAGAFFQIADMADEYNAMLTAAFDWASDWSAPDDAYARSASFSTGTGYWSTNSVEERELHELWDGDVIRPWSTVAGVHRHHGFPSEFRKQFSRLGINIDDKQYTYSLKDKYHLSRVHGSNKGRRGGAYNKFWQDFHDQKWGVPTKRKAINRLKELKANRFIVPKRWR